MMRKMQWTHTADQRQLKTNFVAQIRIRLKIGYARTQLHATFLAFLTIKCLVQWNISLFLWSKCRFCRLIINIDCRVTDLFSGVRQFNGCFTHVDVCNPLTFSIRGECAGKHREQSAGTTEECPRRHSLVCTWQGPNLALHMSQI